MNILDNLTIKVIDKENPYKPNLKKIIEDDDNVNWVVEIREYGKWFRIIRLKNYKRTHDFIINNFKKLEMILENHESKSCIIKCSAITDIKELFKDKKLYVEYERRGDWYAPKEKTLTNIKSLFEFWQRDLNPRGKLIKPIIDGIFTFNDKQYRILEDDTINLGDSFIDILKPEKGIYTSVEEETIKSGRVDTTGLYPKGLIKHTKSFRKIKPLIFENK